VTAVALSNAIARRPFALRVPRPALPRRWKAVGTLLSVAWVAGALAYSYPAVKEEIEEKGYLAQTRRAGTPVIPVDCDRAHGIENRDFIREDKNPDQCWMDLANFRRLYPDIAETMDERASSRFLTNSGLPAEAWEGSPAQEMLKAGVRALIGPGAALGLLGLRRLRPHRFARA
jgi:hypothetical protein